MADQNGGPAFPQIYWDADGKQYIHGTGMTLRDYFAAKAVSQMWRDIDDDFDDDAYKVAAKRAYMLADAMIAEREK
jgi:hypothetical protein